MTWYLCRSKNMKICIIFGHHDTKSSFNAHVRDTFIDEAQQCGHDIDLINLFEKMQLPFYQSTINPPPKAVLDYRKCLEDADAMFLIVHVIISASMQSPKIG